MFSAFSKADAPYKIIAKKQVSGIFVVILYGACVIMGTWMRPKRKLNEV
jgi:hypothetical protein